MNLFNSVSIRVCMSSIHTFTFNFNMGREDNRGMYYKKNAVVVEGVGGLAALERGEI